MERDYQPIGNYGVIGDLNSVALVCMDGSIDFMCYPDFDSPSIFAAMLDKNKGGRFSLAPLFEDSSNRQIYLPQTNILLTRFLSDSGVAEVSDFMPVHDICDSHDLVRRAKCVRGEVRFRMLFAPKFNYARSDHSVERFDGGVVMTSKGPDRVAVRLRIPVPFEINERGEAVAEFTLPAGETAAFIMEQAGEGHEDSPSNHKDFVPDTFKATVNYWHRWIGRMTYSGRWREMIERSALTLKMLFSRKYGSIVAAPTFGLPEVLGGERNWDYRYTWIRDASFTLYSLIRLGYTEEVEAFMKWIEQRCAELEDGGTMRVMYGLDGRHNLDEIELTHLEGYKGSRPVRIGNGAACQLQLDIYGELMDAVYLYDKFAQPVSHDLWQNLTRLINWLCDNWQQPDEGIWEVRGGKREFLFSRVMCWVAIDRAIRMAYKRSLVAPLDRWTLERNKIYESVFAHFWDPKQSAFVQYKGTTDLDAATLLMPLVRFIGPKDPRWLSALGAIENKLVEDSLVHRYRNDGHHDGFIGNEGTFSMCSFWFVECLSRSGDHQKARFYLEKMLGYSNHLGLYAEELGIRGEHLGNFPQAFTHLGLISAAFDIDRRLGERRG